MNAETFAPEKLRIRILFMQCYALEQLVTAAYKIFSQDRLKQCQKTVFNIL